MFKKTIAAGLIAGLSMGAFAVPASAHHSAAMFNPEAQMTLKGTVTKFDYLNPHSWLYMNVENEDGTVTEWGFELDAPPRLRRVGVGPQKWEEGDVILVRTNPLRDGRPAGSLVGAHRADGDTFGNITEIPEPPAAE